MAKIKSRDKETRKILRVIRIDEPFNNFIQAKKTAGLSQNTIRLYSKHLNMAFPWFIEHAYDTVQSITPEAIRAFLSFLMDKGHNKGGTHMTYRTIKTYLNFIWDEYDIETRNPISKVKFSAPKPQPLEGISMDEVQEMLKVCCKNQFPARDKAIISVLVDTGIRRSELMALRFEDIDLDTGRIVIKHGKGDKFRIVYAGKECRKALRKYVSCLDDVHPGDKFWLTDEGDPITAVGVLSMLRRTEHNAGIEKLHCFHDFRRCCAIERLRLGEDIFTISRLLGHSDIETTKRYLFITDKDDQEFSVRSSPLDLNR